MTVDITRNRGPLALGMRLRRLSERIDEDAARTYAEHGVVFQQRWWGVLELLLEQGPASVGELAAKLGISHPSVSQTRRSLEAAGLVISREDPQDGRSRLLDMSDRGRELCRRLAPIWAAMDRVAVELNEAADVISALDRLDEALARASLHERVKRAMAEAS